MPGDVVLRAQLVRRSAWHGARGLAVERLLLPAALSRIGCPSVLKRAQSGSDWASVTRTRHAAVSTSERELTLRQQHNELVRLVTLNGGRPNAASTAAALEWRRQRLAAQRARDDSVQRSIILVTSGQASDLTSFNAAMEGCRRLGRHGQALALWEELLRVGVRPDRSTYRLAMVCALRLGRHALAYDVWLRLSADDVVQAGVDEYTAAISACGLGGKSQRALELFDEMEGSGVGADTNAMHVAILACERAAEPARASELLRRMESSGAVSARTTLPSLLPSIRPP